MPRPNIDEGERRRGGKESAVASSDALAIPRAVSFRLRPHLARSFWAFFRAGAGVMLQYRGEILLWAIWGLVSPSVLYAVWSAALESGSGGTIAGLGRGELAAYFLTLMAVGHLSTAWDTYEMGYLIRSGQMSGKLLRPVLPIWQALADNLAYKAVTIMFVVPMWLLFAWLIRPAFHGGPWQWGCGLVALLLGASLNFLMCYVVALIAFWSPKLDATGEIYFAMAMYFGGWFAPLPMLPAPLRLVADILPFRWVYSFPVEVFTGQLKQASQVAAGFATQVGWLVLCAVLFRVFWRSAVKRYTAVSG